MIKNRKENKIQPTPSELLNNFKYINKSDKKYIEYLPQQPLSSATFLKKSQSSLKRNQKGEAENPPFFQLDDHKKMHIQIKPYTYRSPLKKNAEEQRKSDNLIKGTNTEILSAAENEVEVPPSRTIRFKTLQDERKKDQKSTTEKHKLLLQTLVPLPSNQSFKKILIDLNSKFRKLSNTFENNGYGTFIPDIISRFKDIISTLMQSLLTQTLQQIALYQNGMQDLNNHIKDLHKQNSILLLSLQKLRDQHQTTTKDLSHFKILCNKQRELLTLKLQKQKANNSLLYQLRKKGLNLDTYYKTIRDYQDNSPQIQIPKIQQQQLCPESSRYQQERSYQQYSNNSIITI